MCGIVGYIGSSKAAPILLDGLRRLEYRGYDSSGIATLNGGGVHLIKRAGRIENLATEVKKLDPVGQVGISHTRWATHGKPTDENAHPHLDQSGKLALVHNGVIENYQTLKDQLITEGHVFKGQTDTEVLAHLIGKCYDQLAGLTGKARLVQAILNGLKQVVGAYGIAVIHQEVPEVIVGARRGSPLVLGVGKGENFLASDVQAMISHTQEAVYLNDYDVAIVSRDNFEIQSLRGGGSAYEISKVEMTSDDVEKGEFPHYMLKEIMEQPESIRDCMRGRISHDESTTHLGGLNMTPKEIRQIDRIILTACGTALHAAKVGEYLFETLAHIPTEVEYASEFRYRAMPTSPDTLVFCVSQSGETADTLAALREAKRRGLRTLGVCNNVASTVARESEGGVYMHAGPEIGVAATKSFTSQVMVMALLAINFGRIRHMSSTTGERLIRNLEMIPDKVREIVKQSAGIREIAQKYSKARSMLFMGRQVNYPIALEGALKLKEISYIHAEGHASAELKHGVIALIEPDLPSVFIAPDDPVYEKNVSNIEEVRARKGPVIAVTTEGKTEMERIADDVIYVPPTLDLLTPLLTVIPLQLFSYHMACILGHDVDKPRNLAKSVTVE